MVFTISLERNFFKKLLPTVVRIRQNDPDPNSARGHQVLLPFKLMLDMKFYQKFDKFKFDPFECNFVGN
jgi:hypothetical protein